MADCRLSKTGMQGLLGRPWSRRAFVRVGAGALALLALP